MVPPVQVSPLIKLGRYSALFLGVVYGAKRYDYLKPRAEEERRIAAEEKKQQDEQRRIERELAEGTRAAEPRGFALHPHFQKQLLVQMSPTVEGKGRCLGPCWPLGPLLGEWEGEQVWALGVRGADSL
ncbi:ATP synthase subunit e, mitochondrial isoform X2 [Phocoena sinus]|uniref:ATP synthase F(0) complex subunit e, mitochondrial n=1 Tax=Phocoena sinus TaxID=42100 RepID=A0A8C9E7J9_PHOSS|nr:ATP synthase subunit e, mitochondrial isoform X2 [Phocoena sinus]